MGCVFIRHGGKHDWYQNPNTRMCQPVPRHRELNDNLARGIIKRLSDRPSVLWRTSMKPKTFMLIAGEASGDLLAAELVQALRREFEDAAAMPTTDFQPLYTNLQPRFFGAGGPRMAAAGVELAFDLTAHSVIGLSDVVKNYVTFRRLFHQLYQLAIEREPDAIVCVDFSGFNRRFAHEIKEYVRWHTGWFHDWNPRIIQYVSPQVWASREGRARQMAKHIG